MTYSSCMPGSTANGSVGSNAKQDPQQKALNRSFNHVDTDKTLEQAGLVVNQGNVKRSAGFELKC